ncbi:uncharacterized protein IUM83_08881 [Phytophthora cinnamomi]|uniref:uncharacterized protein n=1 Tax=Phytophthora cinnamomi TaxID=4785 RepID=UPI003559EB42|nr:hypothetical protein IUM83_08881 [Phytophthora cinnamomi]
MQGDKIATVGAGQAAGLASGVPADGETLASKQSSSGEATDKGTCSHAVSALWTVVDPGKTTPPTSDDYSPWTVEQLRQECTSRKLRLGRKASVEERVKRLHQFDELHRSMVSATLASAAGDSSEFSATSGSIRLLNVLFSDMFALRFARIGDKPLRAQLDAGETHSNSTFWRDVTSEFNTNRAD